jgi:hypothetical protein
MRDAAAVARNAKQALPVATGQRKARLHRAVNDLQTILGKPSGSSRRPAAGWPG